jgi:hypothetical protein
LTASSGLCIGKIAAHRSRLGSRQQSGVAELASEHLSRNGGIDYLNVNALLVHVLEAAFGAEALFGGALEPTHRLAHGFEEGGRGHRIFSFFAGEGLAFDQKGAASRLGRDAHARRL